MAANNQISNPSAGIPARNTFAVRVPYLYQAKHVNDQFLNLGYDYHGKILRRVTSSELWGNPMQTTMMGQIEVLLTYVIEETKMIKKWFSISIEKNSINLN